MSKLTKPEFFKKYGYAYIENILTEEQCVKFTAILLSMKEEKMLAYEGKTSDKPNAFYDNSYGGNHPDFEVALREVQPRLEEELGVKMTPANSYGRLYFNGGTLEKHVDRNGLDYTLSISLFNNVGKDWPLWCEDLEKNKVPLVIPIGSGGMMLGTTLNHWRSPLVCEEDEYIAQLFMHWSFVK
jgi:hypothetical protein